MPDPEDNVTEIQPNGNEHKPQGLRTTAQRIWDFTQAFDGIEKTRKAEIQKNGQTLYDYAFYNIDDIYNAITTPLTAAGLGCFDTIKVMPDAAGNVQPMLQVVVFCLDNPSDFIESVIPLVGSADGRAYGSDLTFKRRYGLVTMLNLRVPGEDDDGMASDLDRIANETGSADSHGKLDELKAIIAQIDNGDSRAIEYIGSTWGLTALAELSLKQCGALKRTMNSVLAKENRGDDGTA